MTAQKKPLGAVLALIAMLAPPTAQAKENSPLVGTWTLNLEQSIPPQGRNFQPFSLVIRESGEMLDFTQTTTDGQRRLVEFSHRTPTDGVVRELPGMPGAKAAFTRLPSGVIDAKLWLPDGSLQNKICVLQVSLDRQVCLATITSSSGHTVFFKHVLDKTSGK